MIRQRSTYSAAEFFYAIDFTDQKLSVYEGQHANGTPYSLGSVTYPAIWFKKKAGNITVVKGHIRETLSLDNDLSDAAILDEVMTSFDGRYGGQAEFRWDGTRMWGPQQSFAALAETQIELENYRTNFPSIPAGYTGWYSIKS